MSVDPRYGILFEPVQIGPVQAPNRFFQVPHAAGMGYLHANAGAAFRAMRAEGGWGVISTGACDIHHTSDHMQYPYERNWDDRDIPALAKIADQVHVHGSLAALELNHSGINSVNFTTRAVNLAPSLTRGITVNRPMHARAMDKQDIRDFRKWHRDAALRAMRAGYDIVYVYAAHQQQTMRAFLLPELNKRTDEYGGSVENRSRLLREVLEETREAVGHKCGVALRFSVEDFDVTATEAYRADAREIIESLAEMPDLWDVNLSWPSDAYSSRFSKEGHQEKLVDFMKKITTKPVVGVGRFTSPDAMVSQIKRGILDFIGAARPSIADPFLPNKIREGRTEEIRECIGCNICIAYTGNSAPILCTQNPTNAEEWRRGWHPEKVTPKKSDARVLIVGSGPSGLECAATLAKRGYDVAISEKSRVLGGRVTVESALPGLSEWSRVRDYRLNSLETATNVEIYRESPLSAEDALELGFENIVVATGASWRRDGIGSISPFGIKGIENTTLHTPDDVIAGVDLPSPIVVYDDDHNYMAGLMAEMLALQGKEVILATSLSDVSSWAAMTLDQGHGLRRLKELGVKLLPGHRLSRIEPGRIIMTGTYLPAETPVEFASFVLVGNRAPNDQLYQDLHAKTEAWADHGILSVKRIGDCLSPGLIANAVYSGREYAEEFEQPLQSSTPYLRETGAFIQESGGAEAAEIVAARKASLIFPARH